MQVSCTYPQEILIYGIGKSGTQDPAFKEAIFPSPPPPTPRHIKGAAPADAPVTSAAAVAALPLLSGGGGAGPRAVALTVVAVGGPRALLLPRARV